MLYTTFKLVTLGICLLIMWGITIGYTIYWFKEIKNDIEFNDIVSVILSILPIFLGSFSSLVITVVVFVEIIPKI